MKKILLILCLILCTNVLADAQTFVITHYSMGIVVGGSAENLNNSAARRLNTVYSEINYSRKMPVDAVLVIDQEAGTITLKGPETKVYRVDFEKDRPWTNAGRKLRFLTLTGKDPDNNLEILFEQIVDSDGKLLRASVFGGSKVVTYYIQ